MSRIVITLFMALCLFAAPAKAEVKELTFGVIPTDSLDNLKKWFEPFAEHLGKKMGVKINTRYGNDYAAIIEAMRFKKVDFAWFGNKSAIEAANRAGAEVFAQRRDLDGAPGYWSVVIVHKDSPYNSIDEIIADGKNLVFGNGDANSTSGYLVPTYYIWSAKGINPGEHFKEVRNANHETNNLAVARKQVDFATNNTMAQKRFQKSNPEMARNIKIVWQSPLIPNDPICWRKDLPQETKAMLKAAFLAFGRTGPQAENERKILAGIGSGWAPFNNSDNRQLIPIRQINLVKDKRKIENNKDLNKEEKLKRIAEIDRKLAELKTYFQLAKKF
ncbi:MAG: phosphonate ABC transporter substrate-binding protein [Chlorobiales bacterium]|nr:phosphonate ABC transporter substrate-binding protein [Chlorobiales bacterium]